MKCYSNYYKSNLQYITFETNCACCGELFQQKIREKSVKPQIKKCCSNYCAKRMSTLFENKKQTKISKCIQCGITINVNKRNRHNSRCEDCKKIYIVEYCKIKKENPNPDKSYSIACKTCNKEVRFSNCQKNRIYCSITCYMKDVDGLKKNGGPRLGGGKGKFGWYKNIYCGSSYELAWVIYNIDHNIKFERNLKGFDYIYNDIKHKYYPDFKIKDVYFEIKGRKTNIDEEKWKQFPNKLEILFTKDLNIVLKYVIEKYGKNFIRLYDRKFNIKFKLYNWKKL